MVLSKPFIIADIGSCWRRSQSTQENLAFAKKSIGSAAKCRASAVKFQFYNHGELYGCPGDDTYALPFEWLPDLRREAELNNIEFMCTAFSTLGVRLVNDYVQIHKVASSDMKNLEMIQEIATTGKPIIISTGCSHYLEIEWVVNVWKEMTDTSLCILDCVAAYPAEESQYHLSMLPELAGHITAVGVSDHTLSNVVALTSIGFGATVFEKHFDPFKGMGMGDVPDSCVAISEVEMTKYVNDIRLGFMATETKLRRPRRCEDDFQTMHRRRIVATQNLKEDTILIKGVNYGAFRVKHSDFNGAPMEKETDFDGKRLRVNVDAYHGISSSDIL